MDIKELDNALLAIAEKKNTISELDYNDELYDQVEQELHDLEDDFIDNFGDYMEDTLTDIHDEHCPESDVLLPTAYLAKKYVDRGSSPSGQKLLDVDSDEGVIVDTDDYPNKVVRLVIVPGPTRILLQIGKETREEVWTAE